MIEDKKLQKKFMQGYSWIMLSKDKRYKYDKKRWLMISERTQDLRDRLKDQGATTDDMLEIMGRCRDFSDMKFEDMTPDQQLFMAELIFI